MASPRRCIGRAAALITTKGALPGKSRARASPVALSRLSSQPVQRSPGQWKSGSNTASSCGSIARGCPGRLRSSTAQGWVAQIRARMARRASCACQPSPDEMAATGRYSGGMNSA